jgi:GH25 family lysozyme M1 (1,4-beta-N-acetylmuramidase)
MKGVDLSSNNTYDIATNPDHFDFFLIKTTEGTGFVNPDAAKWIAQCKVHNHKYGIYHFFRGNGIAEAEFFIRNSVTLGYHHTAGNIIPFNDVESAGMGDTTAVAHFRDAVTKAWGCHCGFYSFDAYIVEHHYPAAFGDTMPLWFANPSGNPVPSPWKTAAITQTHVGAPLDIDVSALPGSVLIAPEKPLWIVHANDNVIAHTRHPKIWEIRHPRRFAAKKRHQLGFRMV